MINHINFLKPLPFFIFLSSNRILKKYVETNSLMTLEDIYQELFIEHRQLRNDLPDYIHKNNLVQLKKYQSLNELIIGSHLEIARTFLDYVDDRIYVKKEYYESWQNLITFVNPLPLITAMFFDKHINDKLPENEAIALLIKVFKSSSLPSMKSQTVNTIFQNNGMELHLHLNGTSEVAYVWQDVINNSRQVFKSISPQLNQQFQQMNNLFSKDKLINLFDKSKYIQAFFTMSDSSEVEANKILNSISYLDINDNMIIKDITPTKHFDINESAVFHPIKNILGNESKNMNILALESVFIFNLFKRLNDNDDIHKGQLAHLYLLTFSFLNQLLVQQLDQYGFEQFQIITQNKLRQLTEKDFLNRFIQLEGMYDNDLCYLEGRIAPPSNSNTTTVRNLIDRIQPIINAYKRYYEINNKLKFGLILHFIKKVDNYKENTNLYRDYKLRVELKNQVNNITSLLSYQKETAKLIVGIDGASNELDTSPEVFASAFRDLKKAFESHNLPLGFTFHAGEDFIHIVSGIRYIYETYTFLNFPPKSRIGHATAIGLDVKHWRKRIGDSLWIKEGEWLDNLIFLYHLYENISHNTIIQKEEIDTEIKKRWEVIYESKIDDIQDAIDAYFCRQLDPSFFDQSQAKVVIEDPEDIVGFKITEKIKELFLKYHSHKYVQKYNQLIEIKLEEKYDEIINNLQIYILKELKDKDIAIETMPTSNIRISYYEFYKDHHLFRWADPEQKNDVPKIIIASDDPGIFANNLRSEYSHIYNAACEKYPKFTEDEIHQWLNQFKMNTEEFKF